MWLVKCSFYTPSNNHCIYSAAYCEKPYDVLNLLACQILYHMFHIYKLKSNFYIVLSGA